MKIALASDHAGFELKNELVAYVATLGYETEDLGTHSLESVNYPTYGKLVGEAVASGRFDLGILVCGTGIGIGIAANKVPGIRCATCSEPYSAMLSRQHNDANILALGARVVGDGMAKLMVKSWLEAEFEGERHSLRINLLEN